MLNELTRHAIRAWLADLAETSEPSTVGTRLRGMRRFCRWLVAQSELAVAPTDGIEITTPPDEPVPILSDDEIAALLQTCGVPRGRTGAFDRVIDLGRRDEVVPRLLLDTGVRSDGRHVTSREEESSRRAVPRPDEQPRAGWSARSAHGPVAYPHCDPPVVRCPTQRGSRGE